MFQLTVSHPPFMYHITADLRIWFKTEVKMTFVHKINVFKHSRYFMYHQVYHSEIQYGAHLAFVCHVWISEQTATFALCNFYRLVFYNRGGECLLHDTY